MSPIERSRFVILEHDHPFLHYDLLMETGAILAAWRLLQPVVCGQWILSEALPDHRLMYLDYEGPVSSGRGTVRRVAGGTWSRRRSADVDLMDPAAPESLIVFDLSDCPMASRVSVRGFGSDAPQWRFQ